MITPKEKMHYYLGGVTGDLNNSHIHNGPIGITYSEANEFRRTGNWNTGDIKLFLDIQKHRDDFLRKGRNTVAPNIRWLLIGQSNPLSQ